MTKSIEMNDTGGILDLFKALSCKIRFDIVVKLIENQECCVGEMARFLKVPQPNISQHLTILKNAKIIEGYRKGTQICYRVINQQAKSIINALKTELY